ncbi:SDR family oxidoreductase [Solirubrobacter ginsenosidimutans]|uniref:SDR family oxidoreductase n=1 Tax=Solirubrobacter ginsenosidimutans TaxID=490573 RepID=A0A9X3N2U5_9ACTN|nr:SDR family oxidoreductase [Solirubrobacter ginsenosidimutans]MDA0166226.1 SDR family oxidoreductase [Solirubrobacter ginsenosidimutans]
MDLQLNGRVAVVTGASKGIGLAIVRTLLDEGARVVAASRTPLPPLDGELLHVPVDLMDPAAPAEVIARAAEVYGGLDVLVNNLGGPPPGDRLPHAGFLSRDDADWQAILEFNLLSTVRACRAALPLLLERGGGSIINVASVVGRQPAPMNLDYGAAKAAMLNLTKGLSEEFGAAGVRVNSVSPGPTLTPWWTDAGGAADIVAGWAGTDAGSVVSTLAPAQMQLTTGRFVTPQEIADAVALLASPRSASTTGAEWVVDGGMLKAL